MNIYALTSDDLNLDAWNIDDLIDLWRYSQYRVIANQLFPAKKMRVKALRNVGNYAINKAVAMRLREEGNIEKAQQYEAICERIYNDLPKFAKW